VGAWEAGRPTLIGTKGQANSLGAYLYGLDKAFALNGQQAVYLAVGDDKVSRRLVQRLEGVAFLAVQASYASPVTEMADVVLPVEMWAEQSGHFLNLEGRLQEARAALTPPLEVLSNAKVLEMIAARLGYVLDADWKKALKSRASITAIRESAVRC